MGMFDFIKDAGSKIFGKDDDNDLEGPTKSLSARVRDNGIDPSGVRFKVGADGTVTITGNTASQEDREKIVMIVGNVQGISRVDDQMRIAAPAAVGDASEGGGEVSAEAAGGPAEEAAGEEADWTSRTYTVVPGDTLWKISKEMYGEGGKYMKIFEANTPMLKDPDKIYPGQVLRIPAEED